MATTRIMPLHTGKGRSVGKAIRDILDYVEKPEKTDNGRLITSYGCDSGSPGPALGRRQTPRHGRSEKTAAKADG